MRVLAWPEPRRQRALLIGGALFGTIVVLAWLIGLVWFARALPTAVADPDRRTDAIVVLTGGSGRLQQGLDLLNANKADKLFVSGVYRGVEVAQLLEISQQAPEELACCVTLGYEADDTHGNAVESARWIGEQGFQSLRLVTATYHMPRSLLEFRRAMPDIDIVPHPVFSPRFKQDDWWRWPGSAGLLATEYSKYVLAWLGASGSYEPSQPAPRARTRHDPVAMILLRSLAFNLAFYGWTTAIQVVCLPFLLLPRRYTVAGGRVWTRVGLWLLRVLCGVTHEVRGLENLPKQPCILAAKHQSAWDTLVFSQVVGDVGYVVKRELVQIPGFGHYLKKAGVVAVDRKGGTKALVQMIEGVRATLAAGRSVVIFPEGTRTAPGETRPYHPGVAALYTKVDAPVVPVALNSGLFWGRQSFLKRPGRIVLEFLPAMEPGLKRREFLAALERRIEDACAALPKGPDDGRHA